MRIIDCFGATKIKNRISDMKTILVHPKYSITLQMQFQKR